MSARDRTESTIQWPNLIFPTLVGGPEKPYSPMNCAIGVSVVNLVGSHAQPYIAQMIPITV
jgi:hypothetical protein